MGNNKREPVVTDPQGVGTAFTPQSLDDWRLFMAYQPPTIEVMEQADYDALELAAQEDYNARRIEVINAYMVLKTPALNKLERDFRLAAALNNGDQFTARQGLAISGKQTRGKSTAALYLGRTHEQRLRAKSRRETDRDFVPVVYIPVPAASTAKGLMLSFAHYLGIPIAAKQPTEQIMQTVLHVLKQLEVSLVILDEVQNLKTRAASGMEAAAALKSFSERLSATFLYVGVDLPNSDLFSGHMAAQMQGRVTMSEIPDAGFRNTQAKEDWLTLINSIEDSLPLIKHNPGMLDNEANYLFERTNGVIGSLRLLLRKAAITSIFDGSERITRRLLDDIPTDFRAQLELQTAGGTPIKQSPSKRARNGQKPS